MESKSFAKLGIIYAIGQILMKAVSFILLPVYTRKLGAEVFGQLALIDTVFTFISSFLVMAIYSGYIRFYREYDEMERKTLRGTALIFSIFMTCLDVLFVFIIGKYISNLVLGINNSFQLMIFIMIRGLVNQYISLFMCEYKLEYNAKKDVILNLYRLILNLSFVIFYVVYKDQEIIGIYKGYIVGDLFIFAYLIKDNYKKFALKFNLHMLKEMLTFSAGLIPGSVSATVLNLADRYFLKSYRSFSITGIYSIGYKFGTLFNPIFVSPFKSIFTPYKFQVWKEDDAEEKFNRMFQQYHIVGCFVMLAIAIYSKFAISIFTTQEYIYAYKIVPLVVCSYFLYGKAGFYCLGIQISNKTYLDSMIMIAAGISNIVLNYIMIPKYGMTGAAIATLLSYMIMNFIYLKVSVPLYHVKYNFNNIYKIYGIVVILYFIYYYISIKGYLQWVECILAGVILIGYIILLIIFKVVTLQEVNQYKKFMLNNILKK